MQDLKAAGKVSTRTVACAANSIREHDPEQYQRAAQASKMAGSRNTLADSASSVATLDAVQLSQTCAPNKSQSAESDCFCNQLVPCQPIVSELQQSRTALTDVPEPHTAEVVIPVDEKTGRGVTAADDGRRWDKPHH